MHGLGLVTLNLSRWCIWKVGMVRLPATIVLITSFYMAAAAAYYEKAAIVDWLRGKVIYSNETKRNFHDIT